jgi:hypothetical protein
METIFVPQPEPVYIKALVNGLCATAVLWTFWIPFILIVAKPLDSAMVKGVVCKGSSILFRNSGGPGTYNENLSSLLYQLVNLGTLTRAEADTILKKIEITGGTDLPAQNIISNNVNELNNENLPLTIIFILFGIVLISGSIFLAYLLSSAYNINGWNIIKFNIIMGLIIVSIESFFFGFVAIKYVPFDIPLILSQFKYKIQSYLTNLTAQPCTMSDYGSQTVVTVDADRYISSDATDLLTAKNKCLEDPQCDAVLQELSGDFNFFHFGGKGERWSIGGTLWTLNNCSKYQ